MSEHTQQLRVAVTGATGFIGAAICRVLHAGGHAVRILARSPRRAQALAGNVDEIVQGDLHDAAALARLVAGADAVVHCAGAVRGSSQAGFDRINVEGVANLVAAMAGSGARLLSLSSLAAREPSLSFYAMSKYRGEQVLQAAGGGLTWMVLRPPAVYGPGDRELLPVFQLMARGLAPVPGDPAARFSMIFVDDLAAAVLAWLCQPQPATGVYTLDDGTPGGYDWRAVADTVACLCGRRVRLLRVPSLAMDVPAYINRALARVLGYAPMLTPEKLRELRHPDWVCDSTALQTALDWKPRYPLQAGLAQTPGWCSLLSI